MLVFRVRLYRGRVFLSGKFWSVLVGIIIAVPQPHPRGARIVELVTQSRGDAKVRHATHGQVRRILGLGGGQRS